MSMMGLVRVRFVIVGWATFVKFLYKMIILFYRWKTVL